MFSTFDKRNPHTPLFATIVLLGALGAPAPAEAGPWTKYRELQLSDTEFAGVVTNIVDNLGASFCATTMPCVGNSSETCVLERIRTANSGAFSYGTMGTVDLGNGITVQGPATQFTLQVELDQMTLACANDPACVPSNCTNYPGCLPPGALTTHSVPVRFELGTKGSEVCLSIAQIANGLVPVSALTDVGVPAEFCFGAELGAVDQLMLPLVPGVTGITWDNVQNVVAVRTDYLPPAALPTDLNTDREAAFTAFINGTAAPGAPAEDWNILLSGDALKAALRQNLIDGVSDESKLRLEQGGSVGAMYLPGVVQASTDAEAYTNSFCDWVGISPLWVSMSPSLSSNAQEVIIDSQIGYSVNGWDVVGCILSNPIGLLLAPFSVPIGLGVAYNQGPNSLPSFGQLACTEVTPTSGDLALTCAASVPQLSTTIPGGSLSFDLTGDSHSMAGWRLLGDLAVTSYPVATQPWHVTAGIGYGVTGGCSSLGIGYSGSATLSGPVQLCNVEIRSNPHGVYGIGAFEPAPGNVKTAELKFPSIMSTLCPTGNGSFTQCPPGQSDLDDFWLDPQPFEVRLTTKRGMRTFSVQPPTQATAQDQLHANMLLINAKILCMSPQTGFLGIPGMFDPRWMIDPPPWSELLRGSGRRIQQLGTVQLTDVQVGLLESPMDVTGAMSLDAVPVIVEAVAVVRAGRSSYEVPVSFRSEMSFEVELFTNRSATFTQVTDSLTELNISNALPRELDGARFSAMLPAGAVEVIATY